MPISNQIVSFKLSSTNFTGSTTQLNYTAGVTEGSALASKALILDSNKIISGIERINAVTLAATTLIGTLTTQSQPNITSVGNLSALTVNGNLSLSGHNGTNGLILGATLVTSSANQLNYNNITTIGIGQASKTLVLDSSRNISNINSLTTSTLVATTINLNGTNITSSSTQLNYNNISTPGSAENSKTLVLNSSGNISGINILSATSLTGTLTTAAQTNITSLGSLTGLTTAGLTLGATAITATGAELNILSGVIATSSEINKIAGITAGTVTASKAIIVDTNKDISGFRNITVTGTISGVTTLTTTNLTFGGTSITATGAELNILSGVTATSAEINKIAGITAGTISLSKAVIVDTNKDISGFRNISVTGTISGVTTLTATSLVGTLTTPAQTAITSVGNLTGLTTAGLTLGATTLTATGAELNILSGVTATSSDINKLASVTAGTVSVSKAVIVDTNKDISGFRNITVTGTISGVTTLTATSLAGTLTTSAQTAITSVGTLTSLTLAGSLSGVTTLGLSGILTSSDSTTSTSNSTGALKLAGGLGISNTTDATSSTNGGTFTSAGGGAFAKSLFVGNNLTVGGNLTVTGTTTTVNSTTVNVTDNTIVLNSGPSGTGIDAGFLTQRYQIANNAGTGDVVGDTSTTNFAIVSGTTTTIVLPGSASAVDNFYTNWWIKITSGSANNNVRKVINYVGSTKTLTLETSLSSTPSASNTVNLYNNIFPTFVWQESNKRFITATTTLDSSGTITLSDYADLASRNLTLAGTISGVTTLTATNLAGTLTTPAQTAITSVGNLTGLTTAGLTLGATAITSTGTEINTLAGVTAGTASASKALILDSNKDISGIRTITLNQNVAKPLYILNSSLANAGSYAIALGKSSATDQQGEITFTYSSTVGLSNLSLGHYSSATILNILSNGKVGIGNTNPSYTLDVTGSINASTSLYLSGTQITASATEINTVAGVTAGTITASKHIVVDANKDISGFRNITVTGTISGVTTLTATSLAGTLTTAAQTNITSVGTLSSLTLAGALSGITTLGASGIVTLSNATASSSVTTGALVVTGGVGVSGTLNASTVQMGTLNIGGTNVTASAIELNYNDITTIGTAEASKTLVLDSSKNISGLNKLSISSTTQDQLNITNSSTSGNCNIKFNSDTKSWELGSRGSASSPANAFYLYDNTAGAMRLYVDTNGNLGVGNTATSLAGRIDMGATSSDRSLLIYNNTTSAYGFGANNSLLKIYSGTTTGIAFYTGATSSSVGTERMRIDSNGVGIGTTPSSTYELNVAGSIYTTAITSGDIASSGVVSSTYSIPFRSTYSSCTAEVQNNGSGIYIGPTTSHFISLQTGNSSRLFINTSGYVGIGNTSPSCPLDVTTYANMSTGSGYAYWNSGNSSGTAGTTTQTFSARFSYRILVGGEVDVVSDYRLKKNIVDLTIEECKLFIEKTKPVKFKFKNDDSSTHYGYIAQDIYKAGFPDLIAIGPENGLEEIIEDDGFINPKDQAFTLSLEQIIPILALNIKCIYEEKSKLENEVQELKNKNQNLEERLKKLEDIINSFN